MNIITITAQQTTLITDQKLALDMADDLHAGFQTPSQYARMLISLGVNPIAISNGIKLTLKSQFHYAH